MATSKTRLFALVGFLAASCFVAIETRGIADTPAPKGFVTTEIRKEALGDLAAGKYVMRAVELVMEPGAEVPFHVHKGPGIRYVLEGAITINWKEGKTETYEAGSTYFEGLGENHPAGTISAKNNGKVRCRVIIVELLPQQ